MRVISRVLKEPLDVTTEPIKMVRDSVLLQVSLWIVLDHEDSIEVVQTHEVTWNVMREMFIDNTDASKFSIYIIIVQRHNDIRLV